MGVIEDSIVTTTGGLAETECSAAALRDWFAREHDPAARRSPRLLASVREAARTRHLSRRTEKAYIAWVRRYA
jgi:hypothetical protein